MAKQTIQLTEAIIDNMVRNIIEEELSMGFPIILDYTPPSRWESEKMRGKRTQGNLEDRPGFHYIMRGKKNPKAIYKRAMHAIGGRYGKAEYNKKNNNGNSTNPWTNFFKN